MLEYLTSRCIQYSPDKHQTSAGGFTDHELISAGLAGGDKNGNIKGGGGNGGGGAAGAKNRECKRSFSFFICML